VAKVVQERSVTDLRQPRGQLNRHDNPTERDVLPFFPGMIMRWGIVADDNDEVRNTVKAQIRVAASEY
jgi:hypothetical protein